MQKIHQKILNFILLSQISPLENFRLLICDKFSNFKVTLEFLEAVIALVETSVVEIGVDPPLLAVDLPVLRVDLPDLSGLYRVNSTSSVVAR